MVSLKDGRSVLLRRRSQQVEHLPIGVKLFMLRVDNTVYVGAAVPATQSKSSARIWAACQ